MRALARLPQTLIEHHCRDRLRAWSTNAHRHVSERQALSFGQVPSAIVSATAASTSASAPTAPPLCGTRRIEPLSNRTASPARRAASSSVADAESRRLAEIVAMLLELGRIDKRLDQFQRGHNLC